jgi:sialate O-acetylesterase
MNKVKPIGRGVFGVFVAGLLMLRSAAQGAVTLPALFSNNAVLQRDMPVPIWGTAAPNEQVTVEFSNQKKVATADTQGKWKVTLEPMAASVEPRVMTITPGNLQLTNVLVGEVWLCSGQSNMERQLGPRKGQQLIYDYEREKSTANYPLIRQFSVGAVKRGEGVVGKWAVCTPESVVDFSAVGYFFGRDLQASLKVPVALILSAVGGTPAEAWISTNAFAALPDSASYVSSGRNQRKSIPGSLYSGLIAPLQPYAIRGVIWYQGEANNGRAKDYQRLLSALIQDWRQAWEIGEFPFLFVQIAPHEKMSPELREAQLKTWQSVPRTAMVVVTDWGDAKDIHPTHKQPVGARLALAARAIAYGEKLEYSGPIYAAMKVNGNAAVLSFTHCGSGLVSKGGGLKGFAVAGHDGKFVKAAAIIKSETVEVASVDVAKPVSVRYGWTNVPDVNLFNREGLPASPFRTDDPR